jgi:integrase
MGTKVTKTRVDALTVGKDRRPAFLWSADIPGFGVKAVADGRKIFLFQYRPKHYTREQAPIRLTIGAHGKDLTLAQAERIASDYRMQVKGGLDPRDELRKRIATQRAAAEAGDRTVGLLADLFLERLPTRKLAKRKRGPSRSTVSGYEQLVRLHVKPRMGTLAVAEATRADIEAFHVAMKELQYQANRALTVLRQMFHLAEDLGWRPLNSNPCTGIVKYAEESRGARREVMLRPEQIASLFAAIAAAKQPWHDKAGQERTHDPFAVLAIELDFWLGWRLRSELLPMRWDDLDLEAGSALLRNTKTQDVEYRALPDEAVRIFHTIPRIAGNPYVFPGRKDGTHLTLVRKVWVWIRDQAGLGDLPDLGALRPHDLRHNAVSWHLSDGASLEIAGKLVGHRSRQATQVYAHFIPDHLRQAANRRAEAMKRAAATLHE